MNKKQFDDAVRINRSIEHYEEMKCTLKSTFDSLCHDKTTDHAEVLVGKPKGDSIVYMFVNHFTMKIDGFISELRKEFEEL